MRCLHALILLVSVCAEQHFTVLNRLEPQEVVTFNIALTQRNLDKLDAIYEEVTDPDHPNYKEYLTRQQVFDLVSPPKSDRDSVVSFLATHSITADDMGDYLIAHGAAMDVQTTFNCTLYHIRHNPTGKVLTKIQGAFQYNHPLIESLQALEWLVPFHRVGGKPRPLTPAPQHSYDATIPLTYHNLYNIGSYSISTSSSQGAGEIVGINSFNPTDLQQYATGVSIKYNKVHTHGPYQPNNPDGEATLDVQMIVGVGTNGTNHYFTTSGGFLELAQLIASTTNPSLTNSMSWCQPEPQTSSSEMQRTNAEYQKLATMGITMLSSSGDSGACSGASQFQQCWPSTSPYIISVSASQLETATGSASAPACQNNGGQFTCAVNGTEGVSGQDGQNFVPGGGFSDAVPIPTWQKTAVSAYFANNNVPKPSGGFNKNNRAVPDVSANGDLNLIRLNGQWQLSGGTSASAPIWAAILAILNDHLMKNGKKPLGACHKWLYGKAATTTGAFRSLGTSSTTNKGNCPQGWHSDPKGWDPVTGWGTPDVQVLMGILDSETK